MDSWENSINRRVSTSPARRTRFKQNVLPLLYPLVHRIIGSEQSREWSCNSSLLPLEVVFVVVSKENGISETHLCAPFLIIVSGKAAELCPFIGRWFTLDCSQAEWLQDDDLTLVKTLLCKIHHHAVWAENHSHVYSCQRSWIRKIIPVELLKFFSEDQK